jgi:UrcA family protein
MNLSTMFAASMIIMMDAPLVSAHALPVEQAPTQTVVYRDLNLGSPEGVATLKHRVAWAVRAVCGEADSLDLHKQALIQQCRRDAQAKSGPMVLAAITHAGQNLAGQSDLKVASR